MSSSNGTVLLLGGVVCIETTYQQGVSERASGSSVAISASDDAVSFVLVRSGESTHSVDNDQRRVPLSVTSRNGGHVTLAIPSDTGVVLRGRWMLFAMSAAGVPSISAPISIGLGQ